MKPCNHIHASAALVLGLALAGGAAADGLLGTGGELPGAGAPAAPGQFPAGPMVLPQAPRDPEARIVQEVMQGYLARIAALEEQRRKLSGAARIHEQARVAALEGAARQRDSVSFPASLVISRHRDWAKEEEERARTEEAKRQGCAEQLERVRGETCRLQGEIQAFVSGWLQDPGLRGREAERFALGAPAGTTTIYNLVFAFNDLAAGFQGSVGPVTAPVPGAPAPVP